MADIYTDAGTGLTADILDGTAAVPTNWYIGWGTGAGVAAKADTTLFTEAAEARVAATMTQPAADTNQAVGTLTSASAQTITNAGVLSALTGGILQLHSDFAGVALGINDSIQFTFKLQHT